MNERIRELVRKNADYWMNHYDRKSLADMELLYKDVGKFAELIARECGSIYDKIDNGNDHLGTDNYLLALQRHFEIKK